MLKRAAIGVAVVISVGCGDSGTGVDPCETAIVDGECIDETAALFVNGTSGSDVLGDGTRALPKKTIQAALESITPTRRAILLCEGEYAEDLQLSAPHAAVSFVGGFDCDWNQTGARPTISGIAGGDGSEPVIVEPVEAPVRFASVRILASHGFGATVAGDAIFEDVTIEVAKGTDGTTGTAKTLSGTGSLLGSTTCEDFQGSSGGFSGQDGAPAYTQNRGANMTACALGGNGTNGADGADGAMTGAGATTTGSLYVFFTQCEADRVCFYHHWNAFRGADGESGRVGQGGGGGGNGPTGAGSGGRGGHGGCGGKAYGGSPGEPSVAMLLVNSNVTVRRSTFITGGGGAGGAGVPGAVGAGGQGAVMSGGNGGCEAGAGGKGGKGAPSGGGAGGDSVGIMVVGPAPDVDAETIANAQLGPGGAGGASGGTGAAAVSGARAFTVSPPTTN